MTSRDCVSPAQSYTSKLDGDMCPNGGGQEIVDIKSIEQLCSTFVRLPKEKQLFVLDIVESLALYSGKC